LNRFALFHAVFPCALQYSRSCDFISPTPSLPHGSRSATSNRPTRWAMHRTTTSVSSNVFKRGRRRGGLLERRGVSWRLEGLPICSLQTVFHYCGAVLWVVSPVRRWFGWATSPLPRSHAWASSVAHPLDAQICGLSSVRLLLGPHGRQVEEGPLRGGEEGVEGKTFHVGRSWADRAGLGGLVLVLSLMSFVHAFRLVLTFPFVNIARSRACVCVCFLQVPRVR
jgi:hypothetical protein